MGTKIGKTEIEKITRVEVIDSKGRSYSTRNCKLNEIQLQDDGKTMKLFLTN